MRMTEGMEYGIKGILCLARRCGDEPVLTTTLAQSTLEDDLRATS